MGKGLSTVAGRRRGRATATLRATALAPPAAPVGAVVIGLASTRQRKNSRLRLYVEAQAQEVILLVCLYKPLGHCSARVNLSPFEPFAALPLRSRLRSEPAVRRCNAKAPRHAVAEAPLHTSSALLNQVDAVAEPNASSAPHKDKNDRRHATRPEVHLLRLRRHVVQK